MNAIELYGFEIKTCDFLPEFENCSKIKFGSKWIDGKNQMIDPIIIGIKANEKRIQSELAQKFDALANVFFNQQCQFYSVIVGQIKLDENLMIKENFLIDETKKCSIGALKKFDFYFEKFVQSLKFFE